MARVFKMTTKADHLGVTVWIEKGHDGAPVVYIDTDWALDGGSMGGPLIRVHLNDFTVYDGTRPVYSRSGLAGQTWGLKDDDVPELLKDEYAGIYESISEEDN